MRFHSPASINPKTVCSLRSKAAPPARSMRRANFATAKRKRRSPGTRRSRRKLLARSALPTTGAWLAAAALALSAAASAQGLRADAVVEDPIAQSVTGMGADAVRGRPLVADRHSPYITGARGPVPE